MLGVLPLPGVPGPGGAPWLLGVLGALGALGLAGLVEELRRPGAASQSRASRLGRVAPRTSGLEL